MNTLNSHVIVWNVFFFTLFAWLRHLMLVYIGNAVRWKPNPIPNKYTIQSKFNSTVKSKLILRKSSKSGWIIENKHAKRPNCLNRNNLLSNYTIWINKVLGVEAFRDSFHCCFIIIVLFYSHQNSEETRFLFDSGLFMIIGFILEWKAEGGAITITFMQTKNRKKMKRLMRY